MRQITTTALILFLSGCSTLQTGYRQPLEVAYQSVHLIDTLQTASLHNSRCFEESTSAWALGSHPSVARTAVWGAGLSVGHAYVTGRLVESGHSILAKVWGWLTFGEAAYSVGNNYSIGIRIGSSNNGCVK